MSSPMPQGCRSSLLSSGDEYTASHLIFFYTNLTRRVPCYTGQGWNSRFPTQPLLECVERNNAVIMFWNFLVFLVFPLSWSFYSWLSFFFPPVCSCPCLWVFSFPSPSPVYICQIENPGNSPPCFSPGAVICSWSAFLSPSLKIVCLFYIWFPGFVAELSGDLGGNVSVTSFCHCSSYHNYLCQLSPWK